VKLIGEQRTRDSFGGKDIEKQEPGNVGRKPLRLQEKDKKGIRDGNTWR